MLLAESAVKISWISEIGIRVYATSLIISRSSKNYTYIYQDPSFKFL